jgi:hypothetical protein
MGDVFRHPSLIAIEVAWRWLFGIPFLFICWAWAVTTLNKMEFEGLNAIDTNNPWLAATQLSTAWHMYQPLIREFLGHLILPAAGAWIVLSGLGRAWLLMRLAKGVDGRARFRPATMILLQALWLGLWSLTVWCWYSSMGWLAATHINVPGEPDLVGYFIWAIFLSLGFFTAFALSSWPLLVAPLLAQLEDCSVGEALAEALRLGKPFTGKLAEINLVLGIAKLALIVVAMVFSAAPLPFSDQLGEGAMHVVAAASVVFYLVANDFFQVVRLKAFLAFWKVFRGPASA